MNSDKPLLVQITLWLAITQLLLVVGTPLAYSVVKDIPPGDESLHGKLNVMLTEAYQLQEYEDSDYALGIMIGNLIFPFLLMGGALIFLYRRNFWMALGALSLFIVVMLGHGIPWIAGFVLLLMFLKPVQNYLRKLDDNQTSPQDLGEFGSK